MVLTTEQRLFLVEHVSLKNGKEAGIDNIAADLIKLGVAYEVARCPKKLMVNSRIKIETLTFKL